MTAYSYSRIGAFENCPLQYKFAYIDHIETEEEGIEAFMGIQVHGALEKLYVDLQKSKLNSLDDLLKYYKRGWEKDWHDGIVIAREGYTPENYLETGRKCIERYYNRLKPFDQGIPIGIEKMVSFQLGAHTFRGKIDRLDRMPDGSYEIHDYKASGHLPTQAQADADRQLALYQIGIQRAWKDVERVKLVWHYLQFDTDLVSTRTVKQLEVLESETVALMDRIEGEKVFDPKPSALCDWCPYWAHCPEKKHLVKIEGMEPAEAAGEDGFALVNEYAKLKAQERGLSEEIQGVRDRLVEYARKAGVRKVRGSSAVASVSVRKGLGLPSRSSDREGYEKVVEVLKGAGLWEDFSVLDGNGLLGAMGEGRLDMKVAKALHPLTRESERTDVRLSKLKEGEE